jgi:NADPH-dependent 2,4-dienoyl-CoA reductase/sulfur reductase-like enzyme
VEYIDPGSKTVGGKTAEGGAFQISYDRLLIATGATPIIPDLPGFDLPGVMGLKSLEDGRRIKQFIEEKNVKRIVIIGMGYIALEMCEALRGRGIKVDMVKPRRAFLPWLQEDLGHMVRDEVEARGVGVNSGHGIKEIREGEGGLKVVCEDLTLDCEMVLSAAGIKPVSDIAEEAGLQLGPDRAIAVDRTLRTSEENIYAAGDCADAFHIVTGERVWIPLALRANRAGWAVADNITGKHVELDGVAGTAVFKVFDLQVAATGLNIHQAEEAGFDPVAAMIKSRTRAHAHPGSTKIGVSMVGDKKTERLLGVQMVGGEGAAHRVNAPAVALQARMTVGAFAESDMAYAPPFGPVWDPMLTAANQLLKKMR